MKALMLLLLVALVVSPAESRFVTQYQYPTGGELGGGEGVEEGTVVGVARVSPFAPPAPTSNEHHDYPPGGV